jgi:hypothetical protein
MPAFNLSVGPGRYRSRFCIELFSESAAFRFDYNALHFGIELVMRILGEGGEERK